MDRSAFPTYNGFSRMTRERPSTLRRGRAANPDPAVDGARAEGSAPNKPLKDQLTPNSFTADQAAPCSLGAANPQHGAAFAGPAAAGGRPDADSASDFVHLPAPDWAQGLQALYQSVIDEPLPEAMQQLLDLMRDDGNV